MKIGLAIAEILRREGVENIYGYPVNFIQEYCAAIGIRPFVARSERVAANMADAVSRTTSGQTIGVFYVQHGPGIENAMGAVAQAYSESVPMLVITGARSPSRWRRSSIRARCRQSCGAPSRF